jgi:molybdenum cofactor cytidylyltransferase
LKNQPVKTLENLHYKSGMTTSIQAGVAAFPQQVAGYMICLADMPLISPGEYKLLAAAFFQQLKTDEKTIVQPIYQGQGGHPVIFSAHYKAAILKLEYLEGCKPIVQENRAHLLQVEMPGNAVLRDADDEAAYQDLLKSIE